MRELGTDPLSKLARDIIAGASYSRLVVLETPANAHKLLKNVTPDQLLDVRVKSAPHASAILAGLWLWHDALDECHQIIQKSPENLEKDALNLHPKTLEVYENGRSMPSMPNHKPITDGQLQEMTATLAFWHAIMHRREGDFSNSQYWYRRTGGHPIFKTLAIRVSDLINPFPADKSVFRIVSQDWNPSAFVDLVAAVHDKPDDPRHRLAVSIQELEWQVLFDHCTRAASGK